MSSGIRIYREKRSLAAATRLIADDVHDVLKDTAEIYDATLTQQQVLIVLKLVDLRISKDISARCVSRTSIERATPSTRGDYDPQGERSNGCRGQRTLCVAHART